MTCIRTYNRESAHESRRVSGSIQAKGGKYNAVSAASTLHQEVAIPFVRHGQCEGDPKLFSVDSGASVDHTFDPAIGRQRCAASLVPGNRLGGSGSDRCCFGDFNISALKLVSFVQDFGSCAHAQLAETNSKSMFLKNLICILPQSLNLNTIPAERFVL